MLLRALGCVCFSPTFLDLLKLMHLFRGVNQATVRLAVDHPICQLTRIFVIRDGGRPLVAIASLISGAICRKETLLLA